ncbi:dipeptidyl peptidase 3 [Reichenbachiella carrageenanivorans]|uniref:Dipeptidyl peptidase 3 n=1 Tax=Reichenbachiella carrageenanivorans TaxID=2979869 RepID=A0ABY6CZN9_9BACT|nr:dipeptidyl peptidase 3 [Reichenbachiella carrageenanivorans]UXX78904.1 dipeptidyl peptidase 3 [Reichenbachiella carrageenanivorans]
MRKKLAYLLLIPLAWACTPSAKEEQTTEETDNFVWQTEQFADLKMIRYQVPGFDKLSLDQKKLVYYLTQAGLSGRDIIWDQNYRHNLTIRTALENIVRNYTGDKNSDEWKHFLVYTKRVWFSNGIHHHYSMAKIEPEFGQEYFQSLLSATNTTLDEEIIQVIFDPVIDNKKVNLNPEKGLLTGSATNFYDADITAEEVDAFYAQITDKNAEEPISYGLNSKLIRDENGQLREEIWKSGGMYGSAIDQIISWLEKATTVAENDAQKKGFELLIEYYKTGSLKTWDDYNVVWAAATAGDIDYINGFVEVYNDPKGYRGSYESIIQINDFDASARMKVLSENAQWFEDNSPIMDEHKKENVVGVSYKVVNVAGEAGDASPSTPIGVNLPNANWIRAKHGSKSVSLGNIIDAYDKGGSSGLTAEFSYNEAELERAKKHGEIGDKMHTALHEVIGHASGRINPGVGTPKETLKNYASTIEEGRADLVGLYFLMDNKLVELGLIESLEVGKEEYDGYIRNGMMSQLRRLKLGEDIEEAHMRNRAWVSAWAYEQGQADNVIERKQKEGNTYFVINDYQKLREIFGRLLRETQRMKSEGDYEAAKALVEGYGVKVDPELHQEVLNRTAKLKGAPYGGFINPELVPIMDESGNITDITVTYPDDFAKQMLGYSEKYAFLTK